ncbi:MAG TPA: MMPL family transporter [Nevskia sp.]|nr:MMPL family transporter [Nevskia sp.]
MSDNKFYKLMFQIGEPLIYARRRLTMGILLLITALFMWEAVHIQPDAGFDKSIPLKHPYMQVYKQYQEQFGGANTILVALMQKGDKDIYNSLFLHRLKQVTDAVFFLPHIDRSQVQSLFTPNVTYIEVVEGGFFGTNVIPADYPAQGDATPEMLAKVKDHVQKANIIGRLVSNNQHGAIVQADLLEIDPVTGEKLDYGQVADQIEDRVRGQFASPDKYIYTAKRDIIVGKDFPLKPNSPFKDGEVLFKQGEQVVEGYVHLDYVQTQVKKLGALRHLADGSAVPVEVPARLLDVNKVPNPDYTPDISIHVVGFAKVVGDVIDATLQVTLFFLLTLVMTMILLWLYVGSFKLAILPLVCSITAVIWEFGLLHLLGFGLDPFAILVPFLILAVSVSHGVQYVNAWVGEIADNGRNSFDASLFTWRRLAIYGTMAIMTDVAGFAMIGLIPVGIIQEMALNACLGMLAIIITNKVMMPIWLTWVNVGDPKTFKEKQERRDSIFDGLWHLLSGMTNRKAAVTALLICGVLLGWGLWKGKDLQIGDSQKGVPELLPDSRYNNDNAVIVSNFALGTDLIKVIAETDADACINFGVMEQIYHLAWRLDNTQGVQSTLSLPELSRLVYSIFVEGSPKFYVLARNKDALGQAIKPLPPPTGLLNESCSAMPVWTFLGDHRAQTINRVVNEVEDYNKTNSAEFFETHKDVDAKYCEAKNEARRDLGVQKLKLQHMTELLHKKGLTDDAVNADKDIAAQQKTLSDAEDKLRGMDKQCPVNFALASGNVGVMAATNELVEQLEKRILLYVYIAIIICVYLSFFEWQSLVSIMLPLALVSWLAYAVMAMLGIGMKIATLPVVALAVGIGVDYGIYVYATFADACAGGFGLREAYFKTLKMTGKAVVFTGITLGFGVATWLWSGLQFQRDMGKLLVFMFTANMFGAILILPAIASFLLKPRQLAPGEKPVMVSRH